MQSGAGCVKINEAESCTSRGILIMLLRYFALELFLFYPLLQAQAPVSTTGSTNNWRTVDYPVYIQVRNDDYDPCKYAFLSFFLNDRLIIYF